MGVTNRLRFEVLRRDNHTCYYCGAKAPETKITVDHVIPVALGGTDEPSNLVAACGDCNGGKSSASPDAPLVAAVADNAAKWADAMTTAAGKMRDDLAAVDQAREAFDDIWKSNLGDCPRPDDWERSVDVFMKAGLPLRVLENCVEKATHSRAPWHAKWRYMCKVAWSRLGEIQEQAQAVNGGHGPTATAADGADDAYKRGRLSLAKELLDSMTGDESAHYLEHADYGDYSGEELTQEEIACGAVLSALNDVRCDLDHLCTVTEETLKGMPDGIGERALSVPEDALLKHCSPLARRSLLLVSALRRAEDYLHLPAAKALLDPLPEAERAEWLKYAHALCGPANGLDDDDRWLVRAANCARVIKGGRYYTDMCEGPGELTRFCAARGDYDVRIAEAKCCAPDGDDDHKGHRFCARHTEELVDGTFTDSEGAALTVIDYTAVKELVPF